MRVKKERERKCNLNEVIRLSRKYKKHTCTKETMTSGVVQLVHLFCGRFFCCNDEFLLLLDSVKLQMLWKTIIPGLTIQSEKEIM